MWTLWTGVLQAKKQPKNYKFCTLLAFLFSCGKGIRISKSDQININSTCLNLLNHIKFVTIKVDFSMPKLAKSTSSFEKSTFVKGTISSNFL